MNVDFKFETKLIIFKIWTNEAKAKAPQNILLHIVLNFAFPETHRRV